MMIPCTVNQLIRWAEEDRLERILWTDPGGGGLYSIDVGSDTALPCFWNSAYLEAALADGHLTLDNVDSLVRIVMEESVTATQRKRREEAWAIIRPLLRHQPDIFIADLRGPLVRQAMKEHGVTKQTVYRLLRRYWQRGMTPNALLPDYHKSGAAGKDKPDTGKKRGRPRIYDDAPGVNVDEETRKRFRTIVTVHYAKNRKMDLAGAYRALLDRYYSESAIDEDCGQQRIVRLRDRPTMTQFSYWFAKDNNLFALERIRRTPRVYDKDMRAILGSSTAEVVGPGSRYQIDATIADVYLVSRYDDSKIVGRPVLYVVIDVFSRMIVGIHVGFEGPSWVGAMMALANTASDKVEYCHRFGIELQPWDWPCHALPEVLLSDRGETAGKAIETLIRTFNVHVETAAPYRADWKGIVEQEFRLLQADFAPYVPGYIQADYQERGGDDYRLDALLDIDQFTYIILCCVLNHNNLHRLKSYHRDPDMVADGVKPLPIELWEWGIQRRSGRLRTYPEELVRISLLPSDEASVTAQGIQFYGCFYSCGKAMEEHWFERARQQGRWKTRVSYDPRSMDTLFLHDTRESFIPCTLTGKSADFRGMTLWEIDQIRYLNRQITAGLAHDEMVGRLNLTRNIKAKIAEAEALRSTRTLSPASKRARTANIRSNRADDRDALRERDAFRPATSLPGEPAKVLTFPNGSPSSGAHDDDDLSMSEVLPTREETPHDNG
jgi:hypothetical protein